MIDVRPQRADVIRRAVVVEQVDRLGHGNREAGAAAQAVGQDVDRDRVVIRDRGTERLQPHLVALVAQQLAQHGREPHPDLDRRLERDALVQLENQRGVELLAAVVRIGEDAEDRVDPRLAEAEAAQRLEADGVALLPVETDVEQGRHRFILGIPEALRGLETDGVGLLAVEKRFGGAALGLALRHAVALRDERQRAEERERDECQTLKVRSHVRAPQYGMSS
jgi:hypothetical protein